MLGSHLQSSADVARYQFAGVALGGRAQTFVFVGMEQQVVAHTAADKALFDARQGIHGLVDVDERLVVGIQIGADGRVDARGPLALFAEVLVAAAHPVHIGRGAAQVAQVALEIGHGRDGAYLLEDAFGRAAHDKFPLVGRDGAEGTAAKAAAVQIDRKLYHLVRWNALALVLGMRQTGIGEVERAVDLLGGHRRIGRMHHHVLVARLLDEALRMQAVALLLHVAEIGRLRLGSLAALLVGGQKDVVFADAAGDVSAAMQGDGLAHGTFAQQLV